MCLICNYIGDIINGTDGLATDKKRNGIKRPILSTSVALKSQSPAKGQHKDRAKPAKK